MNPIQLHRKDARNGGSGGVSGSSSSSSHNRPPPLHGHATSSTSLSSTNPTTATVEEEESSSNTWSPSSNAGSHPDNSHRSVYPVPRGGVQEGGRIQDRHREEGSHPSVLHASQVSPRSRLNYHSFSPPLPPPQSTVESSHTHHSGSGGEDRPGAGRGGATSRGGRHALPTPAYSSASSSPPSTSVSLGVLSPSGMRGRGRGGGSSLPAPLPPTPSHIAPLPSSSSPCSLSTPTFHMTYSMVHHPIRKEEALSGPLLFTHEEPFSFPERRSNQASRGSHPIGATLPRRRYPSPDHGPTHATPSSSPLGSGGWKNTKEMGGMEGSNSISSTSSLLNELEAVVGNARTTVLFSSPPLPPPPAHPTCSPQHPPDVSKTGTLRPTEGEGHSSTTSSPMEGREDSGEGRGSRAVPGGTPSSRLSGMESASPSPISPTTNSNTDTNATTSHKGSHGSRNTIVVTATRKRRHDAAPPTSSPSQQLPSEQKSLAQKKRQENGTSPKAKVQEVPLSSLEKKDGTDHRKEHHRKLTKGVTPPATDRGSRTNVGNSHARVGMVEAEKKKKPQLLVEETKEEKDINGEVSKDTRQTEETTPQEIEEEAGDGENEKDDLAYLSDPVVSSLVSQLYQRVVTVMPEEPLQFIIEQLRQHELQNQHPRSPCPPPPTVLQPSFSTSMSPILPRPTAALPASTTALLRVPSPTPPAVLEEDCSSVASTRSSPHSDFIHSSATSPSVGSPHAIRARFDTTANPEHATLLPLSPQGNDLTPPPLHLPHHQRGGTVLHEVSPTTHPLPIAAKEREDVLGKSSGNRTTNTESKEQMKRTEEGSGAPEQEKDRVAVMGNGEQRIPLSSISTASLPFSSSASSSASLPRSPPRTAITMVGEKRKEEELTGVKQADDSLGSPCGQQTDHEMRTVSHPSSGHLISPHRTGCTPRNRHSSPLASPDEQVSSPTPTSYSSTLTGANAFLSPPPAGNGKSGSSSGDTHGSTEKAPPTEEKDRGKDSEKRREPMPSSARHVTSFVESATPPPPLPSSAPRMAGVGMEGEGSAPRVPSRTSASPTQGHSLTVRPLLHSRSASGNDTSNGADGNMRSPLSPTGTSSRKPGEIEGWRWSGSSEANESRRAPALLSSPPPPVPPLLSPSTAASTTSSPSPSYTVAASPLPPPRAPSATLRAASFSSSRSFAMPETGMHTLSSSFNTMGNMLNAGGGNSRGNGAAPSSSTGMTPLECLRSSSCELSFASCGSVDVQELLTDFRLAELECRRVPAAISSPRHCAPPGGVALPASSMLPEGEGSKKMNAELWWKMGATAMGEGKAYSQFYAALFHAGATAADGLMIVHPPPSAMATGSDATAATAVAAPPFGEASTIAADCFSFSFTGSEKEEEVTSRQTLPPPHRSLVNLDDLTDILDHVNVPLPDAGLISELFDELRLPKRGQPMMLEGSPHYKSSGTSTTGAANSSSRSGGLGMGSNTSTASPPLSSSASSPVSGVAGAGHPLSPPPRFCSASIAPSGILSATEALEERHGAKGGSAPVVAAAAATAVTAAGALGGEKKKKKHEETRDITSPCNPLAAAPPPPSPSVPSTANSVGSLSSSSSSSPVSLPFVSSAPVPTENTTSGLSNGSSASTLRGKGKECNEVVLPTLGMRMGSNRCMHANGSTTHSNGADSVQMEARPPPHTLTPNPKGITARGSDYPLHSGEELEKNTAEKGGITSLTSKKDSASVSGGEESVRGRESFSGGLGIMELLRKSEGSGSNSSLSSTASSTSSSDSASSSNFNEGSRKHSFSSSNSSSVSSSISLSILPTAVNIPDGNGRSSKADQWPRITTKKRRSHRHHHHHHPAHAGSHAHPYRSSSSWASSCPAAVAAATTSSASSGSSRLLFSEDPSLPGMRRAVDEIEQRNKHKKKRKKDAKSVASAATAAPLSPVGEKNPQVEENIKDEDGEDNVDWIEFDTFLARMAFLVQGKYPQGVIRSVFFSMVEALDQGLAEVCILRKPPSTPYPPSLSPPTPRQGKPRLMGASNVNGASFSGTAAHGTALPSVSLTSLSAATTAPARPTSGGSAMMTNMVSWQDCVLAALPVWYGWPPSTCDAPTMAGTTTAPSCVPVDSSSLGIQEVTASPGNATSDSPADGEQNHLPPLSFGNGETAHPPPLLVPASTSTTSSHLHPHSQPPVLLPLHSSPSCSQDTAGATTTSKSTVQQGASERACPHHPPPQGSRSDSSASFSNRMTMEETPTSAAPSSPTAAVSPSHADGTSPSHVVHISRSVPLYICVMDGIYRRLGLRQMTGAQVQQALRLIHLPDEDLFWECHVNEFTLLVHALVQVVQQQQQATSPPLASNMVSWPSTPMWGGGTNNGLFSSTGCSTVMGGAGLHCSSTGNLHNAKRPSCSCATTSSHGAK